MIKRALFLSSVLSLISIASIAQVTHASDAGLENEKKFNHFVGVQINPLLRQLLTIGSVPNTGNPFLLNYSLNNSRTKWGVHAGVGFSFSQIKDNDNITDRKTLVTSVSSRIGFDKYYDLGTRWQLGFGIDGVYQLSENITNTQVISFDTINTENRITSQISGGGLRGFARFKLSERVLLGTECTMYYQFGYNKTETKITSPDFNQPGFPNVTTTSMVNQDLMESSLSLPVAVYLIFRF
jgi:hypothetical protein